MRLLKIGKKRDITEFHEYFLWFPLIVKCGHDSYEIRWFEKVMRRCRFLRVFDDQGVWDCEYETKEYYDNR